MNKKILQKILRFLAKRVIKKYKPQVIGITGSVGKTSTTHAIYTVLSGSFVVRQSFGNYNNEIGLPLTILGARSAGRNLWRWLGIIFKSLWLIIKRDKNYPEILILEMGVDRRGNMKYLTSIVRPNIGVVTKVAPVHSEHLGTLEDIAKEKSGLVKILDKSGVAILNGDDGLVKNMANGLKAKVLTYGFGGDNDIVSTEEKIVGAEAVPQEGIEAIRGAHFKVSYGGHTVPVLLPNIIGRQAVEAALAAVSVGVTLGLNIVRIAENLKQYQALPGRMNLLTGIKYTLIIDDTYNASPPSVLSALLAIDQIVLPNQREKYIVLGDMLELGAYSEKAHREIGRRVAELKLDYLITVGHLSKYTANAAEAGGMSVDHIFSFTTSVEAGRFLQDRIEQGDLIFVKGSRSMRMEKVVRELMAEPLRADELLVH